MYRLILTALLAFAAVAVALGRIDVPGAASNDPHAARLTDCNRDHPATQGAPTPAWAILEQMNGSERTNSCIQLELPGDASPLARVVAGDVADLWNLGRYEEALAGFRGLGELVDASQIAIGNCWRTPLPAIPSALWGRDVRIGNRHSISRLALDIHREFNTLFAILLYRETPGPGRYWSVNVSHNGGATWLETFIWYSSYETHSLGASVLTDYCYVGYGATSPNREARLRRFSGVNGSPIKFGPDNDEMYVTVYTTATKDSIKELTLTSNQDGYNNRLYIVSLLASGAVTFFWSPDTGFVNWHQIATGVANGANGLDACYNENGRSTYALVSCFDADSNVRVVGVRNGDMPISLLTQAAGDGLVTSISAYHDAVLFAFDDHTGSPSVVRYAVNNGGGDSVWTYGHAASDTTTASETPDVALRKGGGEGFVYRYHTPTRELRYIWRNYSGAWSTPVAIADYEPWYNRPAIEYLGGGAFGVAYLRQFDSAAYFDRTGVPGVVEQRRLLVDENVLNVVPNPLKGSGRLNYTLNRPADLRVQVCDRTGRIVRTLFDGCSPAGLQSLTFDAADLVPGVYFVRADADGGVLTVPVAVVR